MSSPQPTFADLVSEFTTLNQKAKEGTASVEELQRMQEVRRMLMQAQQRPVPDTSREHRLSPFTPPSGVLAG